MKSTIRLTLLCFAGFAIVLVISACQFNIPIKTSNPTPTSAKSIETLRADPANMAGCEKINTATVDKQASYKGIFPGHTTKDEVESLLGKPLRINDSTSWEYDNLAVVFNGLIVSELFVAGDHVTTLKDMILEHGCPDAIYALDTNEEHLGEYSRLLFIYSSIGFDFTIDSVPAKLDERVNDMSFFGPGTLEYYSDSIYALDVPNTSKLMTWIEAVR